MTKEKSFTIKYMGGEKIISRSELDRLAMFQDWELKKFGYDPEQINELYYLED